MEAESDVPALGEEHENPEVLLRFCLLRLVLTLVGWMSGSGSSDSGMNTTRISFLALHSFLNRSILAAASSLMGDPELWVGARPQLSGTGGVGKARAGRPARKGPRG